MRLYKHNFTKDGKQVKSEKWYCDVRIKGRRFRLPLFESERASLRFTEKLAAMVNQHEYGEPYDKQVLSWLQQLHPSFLKRFAKMGLIEQNRIEARQPIDFHVRDYIDYLKHKGNTEQYCRLCQTRIQNVIEGCKFSKLADVSADKVMRYVSDEMTAGRLSEASFNHYIRQFKGFVRWLYLNDRIETDINKRLHFRTITEPVKKRRALSEAEITFLLEWLRTEAPNRRSLTGWERAVLYQLALTTGLRAAEIRSLTGRSIDFEGKTLTLRGAFAKNRQDAILPLPEQIVNDLKTLTAGKHPDAPLFKLTDKTANLIKSDLNGAKKFYASLGHTPAEKTQRMKDDFLAIETADGEIDFHSLRHTFGSMLAEAGVHPKTAQTLMRHSTITLTLDRYSHTYREAETAAVNSLPTFNNSEKFENMKQA